MHGIIYYEYKFRCFQGLVEGLVEKAIEFGTNNDKFINEMTQKGGIGMTAVCETFPKSEPRVNAYIITIFNPN